MEKSFKYRIYPNKIQEELILKTFGCARFVYNYFLEEHRKYFEETGQFLGVYECSKRLTILKASPGMEWLREPDKSALQQSIRDLDRAYKNFFRRCKNGERSGYPVFKSKKDSLQTYRTCGYGNKIKVFYNLIQLPKVGRIRCKLSRPISGRILSVVVSRVPSGKFYVSLTCADVLVPQMKKTNRQIGIDVGIKEFATLSNEGKIEATFFEKDKRKRITRLQRSLSRKPKESKRHEKTRLLLSKLYEKTTNQRVDFLQKLSTSLIKEYDILAVENIDIKNLLKNKRINKQVKDLSWGAFIRFLEYKANWYGKKLIKVNKYFPSSQLCNKCGYRNPKTKNIKLREWTCPRCGAHHDRDINAAKNILAEGLRILSEKTNQ